MFNWSKRITGATVGAMLLGSTLAANPVIEGNARFTVITPECIRLEYAEGAKFIDASSMFAVSRGDIPQKVATRRGSDGSLLIETNRMQLVYTPNGEPFSQENLYVRINGGERVIDWTPELRQTQNLGGTIHTLDQVKGPVNLEEGILSRDGWYLIDDSRGHLLVDGWVQSRPADAGTDWFLFGYGSDYKSAFKAFTTASGKVPMPRKSVLGSWYSRWWHYSTDDYKQIVEEYRKNDFPLDVIVMDMEWHTGEWTGWSWNYELLPDPPALLRWFREQGLAVTLNVHPADGVIPTETMYADFMKELGEDPDSKTVIPYDAADRRYMEALFKHTHHPREDEGVDFWWLDWQQTPHTRGIPDLLNLRWLNHVYFQNSKRGNKRGLQFSRWGDWGDHRNPIHFSGDADTGWAMLGFEVPFTSTAGNEGTFFWSHDIGGHFGERNEEPYTRWVQFAATTAAMRLHSGIIPFLDRRPWLWPEWATNSMRDAFHFRSRVMPYLYSSVWQCNRDSLPLNRPMYIHYPQVSEAYEAPQQYMFGEAMLVAPIASAGEGPGRVANQAVWFPQGIWRNYFTSEEIEGPQWRVVSADINENPMYIRAGVPIPMQPYTDRPTAAKLKELVVELWPGAEGEVGSFTLYEDDGNSSDYETGKFATTELKSLRNGNSIELTVAPTEGVYTGQLAERATTLLLHGVDEPTTVMIDGAAQASTWDEETSTLKVFVPARSIRNGVSIKVEAAPTDPDVFAAKATTRRLKGLLGEDAPETVAAALEQAGDAPSTQLMALAGISYVENETHYPYVGVLRRIVRNNDSLLSADEISLSWKTTINPDGKKQDGPVISINALDGIIDISAQVLDFPHPDFLSTAHDIRMLSAKFKDRTVSAPTALPVREGQLKDWYISPSFDFDNTETIMSQVYPPEQVPFADLTNYIKAEKWTATTPNAKGMVDIRAIHDEDQRIAYATSVIESKQAGPVRLGFRSDDGIQVWLNGELVHSNNVMRGINHEWEEITVELPKGESRLLLKISQGTNDWGLMVRGVSLPVHEIKE